jgi:preprotein translocase subunit SecY
VTAQTPATPGGLLSKLTPGRRLVRRLAVTAMVILAYRVGSQIPIPGVDLATLVEHRHAADSGLNVLDLFSGGAFSAGSVFALGVLPYVTASLMMQLGANLVPALRVMQRDPVGRRRHEKISKILAVILAVVEAVVLLVKLHNQNIVPIPFTPVILPDLTVTTGIAATLTLVAGFLTVLWLARVITQRGIGNGMSIMIIAATVSGLVPSIRQVASEAGPIQGIALVLVTAAVTLAIVVLTLAERRLPVVSLRSVESARRGDTAALAARPLAAGVVPSLFAGALLGLMAATVKALPDSWSWKATALDLAGGQSWQALVVLAITVAGFTYVYTAIQMNTLEIADDLQKRGMVLHGARPGAATVHRLAWHLARSAVFGGVVLAVAAVLPVALAASMGIAMVPLLGSGLLILASSLTDAAAQYRAHRSVLEANQLIPPAAR